MVPHRFVLRSAAAAALLALLSACGGGDGDLATTTPSGGGATPTAAQQSAFISSYGGGLAALNSYSGLTSPAFLDTIDDSFLDAGYTKEQIRAHLAQEATARATTPDLVFPGVTLSNATITDCDAKGFCTLTATVTNADADSTATTFTTRVRLQDSKVRLYGDQAQAPTV
ncbi:hypothetical protein [Variovorax terrae]|uniref:Lipoprotein n=1 Tax=Variovorax terrae TaxID=2923278 RepID=A0A9X1VXS9_9BURK|nr:hypothetical protein [Variovorax terrae]MCJ0763982.1 hypothetical protein [Variovorax terrae]